MKPVALSTIVHGRTGKDGKTVRKTFERGDPVTLAKDELEPLIAAGVVSRDGLPDGSPPSSVQEHVAARHAAEAALDALRKRLSAAGKAVAEAEKALSDAGDDNKERAEAEEAMAGAEKLVTDLLAEFSGQQEDAS